MNVLILFLFVSISYVTACDRCVHQAKASYFHSEAELSNGYCGYGSFALAFNAGLVVAGSPSLYDDGYGCGRCFQMRCKNSVLCSTSGTKVTMTDRNNNSDIDFLLSSKAFKAMAKPGMEQDLLKLEIANIEYKRIPCAYEYIRTLAIQVDNSSFYPTYLGVKILFQGGQTDVLGVDVVQIGKSDWISMTKNQDIYNGAGWETRKVPNGYLQFRFIVLSGDDAKYILAEHVLPEKWRPGVYNTQVQITDIAPEDCSPCDTSQWK